MKRTIIYGCVVFALIAINLLQSFQNNPQGFSLGQLLNVAFADNESGGGGSCTGHTFIYCFNGGCAASQCSVAGGLTIAGGVGFTVEGSVTCSDPTTHFACCTIKSKCYSRSEYKESELTIFTDL